MITSGVVFVLYILPGYNWQLKYIHCTLFLSPKVNTNMAMLYDVRGFQDKWVIIYSE